MSSLPEPPPGLLDRAVNLLARAMDSVGLNGTRLRWKWSQKRRDLAESGLKTTILLRSATSKHKMCPSCRALVPRSLAVCSECGEGLAAVRAPGIGRLVSNVIPGATAVTSLLLLVNGALFALMLMATLSSGRSQGLLAAFDPFTLVRFGSGLNPLTLGRGEWWRLIAPIFLHGGLLHFAFNSYALLRLGPLVEEEYGTERFVVVYLLSGILGNVFSQLFRPGVINTVGASGAICGLIGLMLVYGMRRGGLHGTSLRSGMTQYAIYLFIFSFLPGVDLLCHFGGFVGGFLLGWVVPTGPFRSGATARVWETLVLASVLLILVSFWQVSIHGVLDARLVFSQG